MVDSTCGICTFENMSLDEIRKFSICQGHLCMPLQKGPRTICSKCILSVEDRYEQIFVDGKIDGKWIDPATKLPIPTCQKSGKPYIPMMQCSEGQCI
jgi:hypothetical protein